MLKVRKVRPARKVQSGQLDLKVHREELDLPDRLVLKVRKELKARKVHKDLLDLSDLQDQVDLQDHRVQSDLLVLPHLQLLQFYVT